VSDGRHCQLIEMGLFDCSEIYEKTQKNLWQVVNPDHTTLNLIKST
jgi:hypothetical protein